MTDAGARLARPTVIPRGLANLATSPIYDSLVENASLQQLRVAASVPSTAPIYIGPCWSKSKKRYGQQFGSTQVQIDMHLLSHPRHWPGLQNIHDCRRWYMAGFPPALWLRELYVIGGTPRLGNGDSASAIWPLHLWQEHRPSWASSQCFDIWINWDLSLEGDPPSGLGFTRSKPDGPHWTLTIQCSKYLQAWIPDLAENGVQAGDPWHLALLGTETGGLHRVRAVLEAICASHQAQLETSDTPVLNPHHSELNEIWEDDPALMQVSELRRLGSPTGVLAENGILHGVTPQHPFFLQCPFISIDESRQGRCPWS
eukprot:gene15190-biopygen8775